MQNKGAEADKIDRYDIVVLIAVFLGWAVSATDITLNGFLLGQITKAFHISTALFGFIGLAFGVGDGLGGFIFGRINDTSWGGRKLTFLITLLGVLVFTVLSGLSVNFPPMFVATRLGGAGIFSGAEMTGGGWVLLAEQIPSYRRSWFISISQGGVAVGYFFADLFSSTFAAPTSLGWRWGGFIANGIIGTGFYALRFALRESPAWSHIKAFKLEGKAAGATVSQGVREIFKSPYGKITALSFVGGLAAAFFGTAFHDYYYADWYEIGGIDRTPLPSLVYFLVFVGFVLGHFAANMTEGWYMDHFGTRRAVLFTSIAVVMMVVFWRVPVDISYALDFVILFLVGYGGVQTIWGGFAPCLHAPGVSHEDKAFWGGGFPLGTHLRGGFLFPGGLPWRCVDRPE
ncbi:MFS transporter [Thermogymnomonas acidicola]|uniref:MFS transporter n=1 Tax=Thermogymnomonas acidicola TaxID=399579 RepID=UPI00094666AD|nr:MFS transporter [Thermogymnomonas acidicola]